MECLVIDSSSLGEARNKIEKAFNSKKTVKIAVIAKSDDFNRKIVENKKVSYLLFSSFSESGRNTRLKQRDSGLNQVLCNLTNEKSIIIAFDLESILKSADLKDYFSRVIQNIKLINKYKVKFVLFNACNYNNSDLIGLLLSLGLNTNSCKYAIENSINVSD